MRSVALPSTGTISSGSLTSESRTKSPMLFPDKSAVITRGMLPCEVETHLTYLRTTKITYIIFQWCCATSCEEFRPHIYLLIWTTYAPRLISTLASSLTYTTGIWILVPGLYRKKLTHKGSSVTAQHSKCKLICQ